MMICTNEKNGNDQLQVPKAPIDSETHRKVEEEIFLQCDRQTIEHAIQTELEKPKTIFSLQDILREYHRQLMQVYTHRGIEGVLGVLQVLGMTDLDSTKKSLATQIEHMLTEHTQQLFTDQLFPNQLEQFPHSNIEIANLMAIEESGLDCIRLGNPTIANSNLWTFYNQKIFWSEEGKEKVLALFN